LHTPPQHRKARVDETEFTLFDEGDMLDLERSLFDGQLSDLTELSDDGSEFSPLMTSGVEFELGLDSQDRGDAALISPLGDWEGVRKAQDGYKLPGADENLEGPYEGLDISPVKLETVEKDVIKRFVEHLVRSWPSCQLNADLAARRSLALADPTAFWSSLFEPEFKRFIDFMANAPAGNRSTRVGCSLISV
jgi:hypothetical protein